MAFSQSYNYASPLPTSGGAQGTPAVYPAAAHVVPGVPAQAPFGAPRQMLTPEAFGHPQLMPGSPAPGAPHYMAPGAPAPAAGSGFGGFMARPQLPNQGLGIAQGGLAAGSSPFAFHATRPASAAQPVSAIASAQDSLPLGTSSGSLPPQQSSYSTDKAGRSAQRSKLCKEAFEFVDALRTGHIDCSQNQTGLMMVFQQLGDLPMPKDEWYTRVFRNFAGKDQDLIDYSCFKEIVKQWDEHHRKKREKQQQQQQTLLKQQQDQLQLQEQRQQPPQEPQEPLRLETEQPPVQPPEATPEREQVQMPKPQTQTEEGQDEQEIAQVEQHQARPQPSGSPDGGSLDGMPSGPWANSLPSDTVLGPRSFPVSRASPEDDADALPSGPSGLSRATAANIASEVMFPTHVGRLAIFDDYLFCGDVGSGSFGKVMLVRHKSTKQLRACKVVAVQTALQRELMDNEIRLLKSLNHPHIMKMHEVYFEQASEQGQVASGNIYLVTELCEGGDLFSRILHHYERLKQPMTESHVAFMMQQILSATKYCHDQGIIHRDIKPENILFVDRSASSPLKIIDFGLANFHEKIREQAKEVKVARNGAMGRIARMLPSVNGRHLIPWHERKRVMQKAGTPHYMAPEMIEGSYDHKADLFSIGIILCQLFTGWHPFYQPGDDETAVRAKISSSEAVQFPMDIWSQVSPSALDLCRKLLDKSPKLRLSATSALAHEWFQDPSKPSPFGNVDGLSVSIFDGLKQYQAYNKLKRAVLQLLTRELSEFQIQELRAKFMALDKEGDGLLSPEELVEGMCHVGYEMSQRELEQIMAALDGSGNQRIGYKEFISALIERRVKFDRQQLFECFKKFDKQGKGLITYQDVKSVMCNAITESEWQEIAVVGGKQDLSDMPELTFDEFVSLMEQTDAGPS